MSIQRVQENAISWMEEHDIKFGDITGSSTALNDFLHFIAWRDILTPDEAVLAFNYNREFQDRIDIRKD